MKERVYCDPKPETEDALWARIEDVAKNLEPDLVKKVMRDGVRKWARKCLRKQGFYAEWFPPPAKFVIHLWHFFSMEIELVTYSIYKCIGKIWYFL